MKVVQDLDEDVWRAFVDNHPDVQIFHTPDMHQAFAKTKGYKTQVWATIDDNKQPLAIFLPVEITIKGGIFRSFTTRAVVYGSVLCSPDPDSQEALRLLLLAYNKSVKGKILFTELRNTVDISSMQPVLNDCGFIHEEHLNFFIDLTRPTDEILKSIRSNARRNIKKARKMGLVIEEVDNSDQIPAVYDLLKHVYKRLQVPLSGISLFQSSFEILYPKGMFKILVAKAEGEIIGALTLLINNGIILYWYTGVLRKFSAYRAADFLVWHTLEWGSQNGYRLFDFGGGGKPDEEYGVRDFKAKYGGDLVNYGRNISVHSPAQLKLSKMAYELVKKFL